MLKPTNTSEFFAKPVSCILEDTFPQQLLSFGLQRYGVPMNTYENTYENTNAVKFQFIPTAAIKLFKLEVTREVSCQKQALGNCFVGQFRSMACTTNRTIKWVD